jgi:predicted nucleotidyltransferase
MLIREKDRQAIIDIAKEVIHTPIQILAYGSRVNGKAHETSDLDLVIINKNNQSLDWDELQAFKERLQDSTIPIIVQVMDWFLMPESFRQNILKHNELFLDVSAPNQTDPKGVTS